jgi:hypothetical protein
LRKDSIVAVKGGRRNQEKKRETEEEYCHKHMGLNILLKTSCKNGLGLVSIKFQKKKIFPSNLIGNGNIYYNMYTNIMIEFMG